MNNSEFDHDQLLSELNNDKARLFIPAILYVGIFMVFGTIGNCMVIYFYGCKSKPSPSASFIFALASFDLVSCVVGMPMEIADLRFFFNFKSEPACKVLRCVTHFASISSGLILVVIAGDRYRRICKPFERQLNHKHVKVICVIIGIVSLLLSWPAAIFNAVVDVQVEYSEDIMLTGKDCTTTKSDKYKPYMYVFNIIYLAAFVIITIILSILYAFISRQLYRHRQFRAYVAQRSSSVRRIKVKSGSGESLLLREASTLSNRVFADPPDASESVVDMKEFVTRGLTQVESDRPTSGYTAVTGTTGLTGLTDLSGRSRRTLQSTLHSTKSMKSVTIDPSQNQVFPIEARELPRPKSGNSESTWTNSDERRPGTASSIATFSSRPSSAGLSGFSEFDRIPQNTYGDAPGDGYERRADELGDSDSDKDGAGEQDEHKIEEDAKENNEEDGRLSIKVFEHDIDGETVTVTNESISSLDDTFEGNEVDSLPNDDHFKADGEDNMIKDETLQFSDYHAFNTDTIENDLPDKTEVLIISDNHQTEEQGYGNATANVNANTHSAERPESTRPESTRPESTHSSKSSKSRRSRRSNVVTPLSTVTTTTSVASRASTIRRIKRLIQNNAFQEGKVNTDTDKVKELRMKMLDINTVKYTLIMLVITIVFVLSFLPYLSLVIWRYYHDEHEVNIMTDTELVVFQIGIRSIFINSSMNPLIYGGFNSKFRAFFYGVCCSCCLPPKRNKRKGTQSRDQSDSTSGT